MGTHKYQHIVPRTYYKPWEINNTNRNLNIVDKTTGEISTETSKKKFGIEDFYTITIDNFYIFTKADKKIAYKPLSNYNIEFEGEKLNNLDDYHKNLGLFEEWNIKDKTGKLIENSEVYRELKDIRILDLEKNWNQVAENNWNNTVNRIESCIISKTELESKEYNFLYNFIASQILRIPSFKEEYIENILKDMLLDLVESQPNKKEYIENMSDSLFKKIIRNFQEGNDFNKSSESIKKSIERLSMIFYYSNSKSFYTSDNPIIDKVDHNLSDKFKGLIFPLTPNLIVIGYIGSKDNYKYRIGQVTDVEVDEINNLIIKNANEKYIKA